MIRVLLLSFLLLSMSLYAENNDNNETNSTNESNLSSQILIEESKPDSETQKEINLLIAKKNALDSSMKDDNMLSKVYSNYHTYKELADQEELLNDQIHILEDKYQQTDAEKKALEMLQGKRSIIRGKLRLLKEYERDPFKKFLKPPEITDIPTVESPFSIISALSYTKKLKSDLVEYENRYILIEKLMEKLKKKEMLLNALLLYDADNSQYKTELKDTIEQIKTFTPVLEIFKTTQNVYNKKIDEIIFSLRADGKREMEKATSIGMIILVFIILILISKYFVRKYMADNDRFYTINKALNVTFGTLLLLTLLFAYIENVDYLVTILGFASAGIAIAMKDWFMSILGWFVIVIGGAIHVGDRVKFVRQGMEYVGDIVDISLLRMTIQEDITLTSYMHNRRAGRIIFVPNNYVFTDMIANYTHAGLKTVWDGIDFMITFDSNASKAASIAKEVTKKYSKGYTEITRKQLNKLRSQYSMKNTNVEPRIYTFIEPYGIKISAWYHTNAYATLTLRSTISMEIIERLQKEDDISLAFPTQSIYMDKSVPRKMPEKPTLFDGEAE